MANVQHIYSGIGNPNDNPELDLQGSAAGLHLYADVTPGDERVWISMFNIVNDVKIHQGWAEVAFTLPSPPAD